MKKMMIRGSRRVFAIALSVLMLLSAWVFIAPDTLPQASAATNKYPVQAYVVVTDDMDNCYMTLRVYGKTNNGTGSEQQIGSISWSDKDVSNDTYYIFNGDANDKVFPTRVNLYLSGESYYFGRSIGMQVHLKVNGSDMYLDGNVASSSGCDSISAGSGTAASFSWDTGYNVTAGKTNSFNVNYSVQSSAYPTPQITGFTGGSDSINVPTTADKTNSTNAFSYTVGTPADQYGVNWYQDVSVSLSGGGTGITFADKKVSVTCDANRAPSNGQYQYTVTLQQKLGSTVKNTKNILINTWQYQIEFYNCDKDGNAESLPTKTETPDYNGVVNPPGHTNNAGTVPSGSVGIAADADGHYTWGGWNPSTYYNRPTSGAQKKVVVATYSLTGHTASAWQSDATVHWKKCTVCGIDITSRNTHKNDEDEWLIDDSTNEHYQNCSTCGKEVPNKRAGHNYSDYVTTDDNQHWQYCETCGKERNRANHGWDYANAVFKWVGYDCTSVTVECSTCHKTKTINATTTSVTNPATCEADGSTTYTAKFTGGSTEYSEQKTQTLTRLGHDFSGTVHQLSGGRHNWLCANGCGNYGAPVNGVMTKNASVACTAQDGFTNNGTEHWKICTECSQIIPGSTENHTPKEDGEGNPIYDNDGTGNGDHHWIECSVCGWHTTNDEVHTWAEVIDVDETCTTDGTKHEACSICGLTRYQGTVIPQLGHDWSNGVVYTWGENHTTYTARRECARGCGYFETETVEVAVATNPATCTTTGLYTYTSYNFTNSAFQAGTTTEVIPIDPDNHDFTATIKNQYTIKKAANCEEDAQYYYSCSRCQAIGNVEYFVDTGSKLGHEFTGAIVNAGSGKHYQKCVRYDDCGACGVKVDDVWTKDATVPCYGGDATCDARPICEGCGVVYGSMNPDNHDFTMQKQSMDYLKMFATCETDAEYYYKCSRCSASTNDATVADPSVTYGGATWTVEGSRLGHDFASYDYHALPGNRHNMKCLNSWFVGTEEVFCDCYGLEVDGVMVKDASEACTPGTVQKNSEEHWANCAYCSNYTTPRAAHTPKEGYDSDNNTHWFECSFCGYKTSEPEPHTWRDVIDTPATCTETGIKHNECSICHKTKGEGTVIPAAGHDWGDITYVWTQTGEDTYEVTATRVCGTVSSHVETETVGSTLKLTKPTCVAEGSKKFTSAIFSNRAFEQQTMTIVLDIDPTNHSGHLTKVNLKKASCTADGVKQHYVCDLCGNKYFTATDTEPVTDADLVIPARGHEWNDGVVTREATCSVPGVTTYTCLHNTATSEYVVCRETKTEEIPIDPTNHDGHLTYVEVVKGTCTETGERAHWYCSACDTKFSDEDGLTAATDEELLIVARPGGHDWNDGVVTKEANCMETGILTKTCTCEETDEYAACGATTEETIAKDANNHIALIDETYLQVEGYIQESCSADGQTGTRTCLGCGTVIGENETIPSPGHSYTAETVKEEALVSIADCASPAIYRKSCVYCGTVDGNETLTFTVGEINPLHHREALQEFTYLAATCLAPGHEAHFHCQYCDKNFSDAEGQSLMEEVELAQLEHSYTGEACNQGDGTHRFQCVNGCGGYGEPFEHVWDDGTTVAATCEVNGSTDYVCTTPGCTGTKHVVIPKLGHAYGIASYKWGEDNLSCTATLACANDIKGDGVIDHTITETTWDVVCTSPEQVTCQQPGRYVYAATFQNSIFGVKITTVELEKGAHLTTHVAAVPPTCAEDGTTEYWACSSCRHLFADAACTIEVSVADTFIPRVGHDYSGTIRDNGDGTHSYACIYDCGLYGNTTAHAFNREVSSEQYLDSYSDCITPATYFYSCDCGAKGTSTFEGTPLGHVYEAHDGKPATCTDPGYTAYLACTRCGYSPDRCMIGALGHGKFLYDREKSGKVYDGSFEWTTYSCPRGCGGTYTTFTIYARDTKGKPVAGATVTASGNGESATGITGNDGSVSFEAPFTDGEYTITISYTSGTEVMTANGQVRVIGNRGSGGVGALELDNPTTPTTEPQPTTEPGGGNTDPGNNNNNNNSNSGGCRYCGGTHTGPFGWLIQLIHNILAAFRGK